MCAFVIASLQREVMEKGQQLVLALAIPRAGYLIGKLGGFFALAVAPALLFGVLALWAAPGVSALVWALSLLCELWIMIAFSALCALGTGQLVGALAATTGFYVLARAAGALALLAHDGLAGTLASALALLLPHLDLFACADWLVYADAGPAQLAPVLLQTALYVPLLSAAALVDLYRKEL
jgi:hypothetical protein